MLLILSTLLGFAAPFIGDVLKLLTSKADRAHEITLFTLRLQAGNQEHLWRMEEINAKADVAETQATHQPMVSFGVQLLDKAQASGMPAWVIVPVFWAFAVLDWVTGMVRPAITLAAVIFYMAYRWATVLAVQSVIASHSLADAIMEVWGENDWAILFMVLAYWFGDRTRQKIKQGK